MPNKDRFTPFSKDNNKFCEIFLKALKGELTNPEIKFAKQYAKDFLTYTNI